MHEGRSYVNAKGNLKGDDYMYDYNMEYYYYYGLYVWL